MFEVVKSRSWTHDFVIRNAAISRDENLLVLLDAAPSICIRRMSDMQMVCRRALDREFASVFISHDGRRVLAVGGDRNVMGASYVLMSLDGQVAE